MRQDLIGQQFERLLVTSKAGRDKYRSSLWLCKCICGNEKIVNGRSLKRGRTKSCGCLNRQLFAERFTTHGVRRTPEYNIWAQAKQRCTNPNHKDFHRYGGRGIKFLFDNFEEFIAHIGPKTSSKHSLDRIDNSGNYEIGNVRWATLITQCRNRRSNVNLTFQNETLCIAGWAENLGLSFSAITLRLRRGWSVEKTLSTPVKTRA